MIKIRALASTVAVALVAIWADADGPANELLGQWYTEDDASKVHVVKKNGKYFGTIIWLAEPIYPDDDPTDAGKPKRNRKNPDKALQREPIIGMQVLKNFTYDTSDREWVDGTIYDPDVGKTYKCVIKFQADPKAQGGKTLNLRGYIGLPALGRTTVWRRVPKAELEPTHTDQPRRPAPRGARGPFSSSASIRSTTADAEGFTRGSNRPTTSPCRFTRNLVKFHTISPLNSPLSSGDVNSR